MKIPTVGGFGLGMIYLPSIVIVGYYFESKRALATGIAVCGSGVGSIILPLLSNFILTYFETWKSVVIMFGIFCLSCIIFGYQMKPLNTDELDDKSKNEDSNSGTKEKLLKNPLFWLMGLCYVFASQGRFVPYIFLPNMARLTGIDKQYSNYLLSITGKVVIKL